MFLRTCECGTGAAWASLGDAEATWQRLAEDAALLVGAEFAAGADEFEEVLGGGTGREGRQDGVSQFFRDVTVAVVGSTT